MIRIAVVGLLVLSALSLVSPAVAQEDGGSKPPPNLRKEAKSPQFKAAVKKLAELTGSKPEPLTNDEDDNTGGVVFEVAHAKADEMLAGPLRKELLAQGAFLFRHDNGHGIAIGGKALPDQLALLPTKDKYVVLAVVGTNGANSDVDNDGLIKWLRDLEKTHPFELTEAGFDFLAGMFVTPPKDAKALAEKIHKFDPDIVDEGSSMEKLIESVGQRKLYLWWD